MYNAKVTEITFSLRFEQAIIEEKLISEWCLFRLIEVCWCFDHTLGTLYKDQPMGRSLFFWLSVCYHY
jgi:hypothetical protein